jgi:phosphomannomutase/phosphoglucomutase
MAGISPHIFRQYDVRGTVGQDLTLELAELLGRAYGTMLRREGGSAAAVGMDNRLSSPELQDAFIRGVLSTGVDVLDTGLHPTPVLYFALFNLPVQGGVQVTGSHNPPEMNGFKIAIGKATIYGERIQELHRLIQRRDFERAQGQRIGQEILPDYLDAIEQRITLNRSLKVVVDAGNGTAGPIAPGLMKSLGCEVIPLYCEMDGRFPNHPADPTEVEALQDLIVEVQDSGADLGVAYDGDGDRIGVIDDQGQIVWGDRLLALLSREVLAKKPGAPIIFEVKCSQALVEEILKQGGRPIMWKTGHSLIKEKMRQEGSPLAGEMSGHMFFADEYYGYDDAIYASCRLLRFLAEYEEPLSTVMATIPTYHSTPEIRIGSTDQAKFRIVQEIGAAFRQEYETVDVDGVRVLFGDGWGLLRASNTQPVLVLRFEAQTPERLEEIRGIFAHRLRAFPEAELPRDW